MKRALVLNDMVEPKLSPDSLPYDKGISVKKKKKTLENEDFAFIQMELLKFNKEYALMYYLFKYKLIIKD